MRLDGKDAIRCLCQRDSSLPNFCYIEKTLREVVDSLAAFQYGI